MNLGIDLRPGVVAAAVLSAGADAGGGVLSCNLWTSWDGGCRAHVRVAAPALLCVPYALAARSFGIFRWGWFAVYALLPVAIAFVLEQARNEDRETARELAGFCSAAGAGAGRGSALAGSRRGHEGWRRWEKFCCWMRASSGSWWCGGWRGLDLICG